MKVNTVFRAAVLFLFASMVSSAGMADDVVSDAAAGSSDALGSVSTVEFKDETFTVKGVSFVMAAVRGGTFTVESAGNGVMAHGKKKPAAREVKLPDFHIGKFEVTQALWEAVMGNNPSYHKGGDYPVESVGWNDICGNNGFLKKLNEMLSSELCGRHFVLPTEAQWEFAARGGNKSKGYKYSGSDNIDDVAWYSCNGKGESHPVGQKSPNELGLYDMSGNVWEWCTDRNASEASIDPVGSPGNRHRVIRGGSWSDGTDTCLPTSRFVNFFQGFRVDLRGFRIALIR